MNQQQLASKIWESANKMRSKIDASDYKDFILGFMFYKFLSQKQEEFLKNNDYTQEDIEELSENDSNDVKFIQDNLGYFIGAENLFSHWIKLGNRFEVASVSSALSAFDRLISSNIHHKKLFKEIFGTLQSGLSKLGTDAIAQSKAVRDLVTLIDLIPMDAQQDYDVLGFVYEYLISNFAVNAGKKAGEFYTPHDVSLLMSEIVAEHLKNYKEIKIYDPTSGSGSLLINIGKSVAKRMNNSQGIKYFAQEISKTTYDLTRMNLIMRGISADNIVTRQGDTLKDDWPYFDESDPTGTYDPLYVDAVVSNPPYSQKWDQNDHDNDPRFSDYGLAPSSKADFAFLLHDLYHLKPKGIMTIVLPHGVLFRGGEEGEIRKNLIEKNQIDAIIGLPANIFFGTGIPTIIMVLKKEKKDVSGNDYTDVLFIDASKNFIKSGNKNKLSGSDVKRIADTVINRTECDKFSRLVSLEEIRTNEYNLNIPRYVDSSNPTEPWDLYSLMFGGVPNKEISLLSKYWEALPNLKNVLFKPINGEYSSLTTDDLREVIKNSTDLKNYLLNFENGVSGFDSYLKKNLIDDLTNLNIPSKEEEISEEIFRRFKNIPLIDKYDVYQLLDDSWAQISIDLEIIQTEGLGALNVVDPNLVYKKKNGIETEVQDGYVGRVLPFDLVQKHHFQTELLTLTNKEARLAEIDSKILEIIESFSEEEKDNNFLNDDNSAFVLKNLTKTNKELKNDGKFKEESFEYNLLQAENLLKEQTSLKKEVKTLFDKLQVETKNKLLSLSLEDSLSLLEHKWTEPLFSKIKELPEKVVSELISKISRLQEKYDTTFEDVTSEIKETEQTLSSLLEELTGDEFDMKGIEELKKLLKGQ